MNGPDNMTDEEFVNWMHEQENSEGDDEEIEVDGTEVETEEVNEDADALEQPEWDSDDNGDED